MREKVLVIAAHLDDEVLGVGATIARHVADGDTVAVLNVCDRSERHQLSVPMVTLLRNQSKRVCKILGVTQMIHAGLQDEYLDAMLVKVIAPIESAIEVVQPTVVYTHNKSDVNQDHRAIFEATLVATRSFAYSSIHSVFSFEILSSTEQAPNGLGWTFAPSYFVDVTKYMSRKINAMKCYKQEMRPYPFPRSAEGIKTLARFRGMASNTKFAEAFEVVRMVRQ